MEDHEFQALLSVIDGAPSRVCGVTVDGVICKKTAEEHRPAVSGNRIRITRLDVHGMPMGEPVTVHGVVSGRLTHTESNIEEVERPLPPFKQGWIKPASMEIKILDPNPELLAALIGRTLKPRPWYWRLLPKRVQRRIKHKEVRRGYGG